MFQVASNVDTVESANAICRILARILNLRHLKLSGNLDFLTLDWSRTFYQTLGTVLQRGLLEDLRINPVLTSWKNRKANLPKTDFVENLQSVKVLSLTFPVEDSVICEILGHQNSRNLEVFQVRTTNASKCDFFEAVITMTGEKESQLRYLFVLGHGAPPVAYLDKARRRRSELCCFYESFAPGSVRAAWQHPGAHSRPDLCAMNHSLLNDFSECYSL